MTRVYLDYNATAPLCDAARAAMLAALDIPGNPSSVHQFGRGARRVVEDARRQLASLVNARPEQVIFTSGATEANNTVLRGFDPKHVLVSAIEHPSVRDVLPDTRQIPVGPDGVIDLKRAVAMLAESPAVDLVSIMLVNNETGVIQPVADLAAAAKSRGILVHCDAVQAAGRIPIDMDELQVDYLTLSAHKIGGPKGVGALIAAPLVELSPLLLGGGQEQRRRAGTENVPAIAGFGAAAATVMDGLAAYADLAGKRDRMEAQLQQISPLVKIVGAQAPRVSNTSLLVLPGASAETMLMAMDLAGVAVSSGAACSSGKVRASHVLTAMGLDDDHAASAIRVSLGPQTTDDDINHFLAAWAAMYNRLRDKLAPVA